MAVGLNVQLTGQALNIWVGEVARDVHQAVNRRADQVVEYFNAVSNAELLAPPFNLPQADIDTLKAVAAALDQLRRIYRGQDPISVDGAPVNKNFRTDIRKVIGTGD